MSGRVSADFGLFKEKEQKSGCLCINIIVILFCLVTLLSLGIYTIFYLTKKGVQLNEKPLEINIERPLAAEKLISSEPDKPEDVPEPFGIMYKGAQPTEFSTTSPAIKTLLFPQLAAYHQKYPKSIQDIIAYVSRTTTSNSKSGRNFKESTTNNKNNNLTSSNDPFYLYKPQDPGDINLLATASFRFAPPIWKTISFAGKNYQESHKREIYKLPPPLIISLNIYPTESDLQLLQRFIGPNNYQRTNEKMNKMIINFNIHSKSETEHEEPKQGSRVKKC